ncbi:MAG: oligosaccharide flippase family protein [Sphingomonadaceae bacterium]
MNYLRHMIDGAFGVSLFARIKIDPLTLVPNQSARIPAWLRAMLAGLGAYASAEAANRVVRLCAVFVIARHLDSGLLGSAALALSLFEIMRALTNAGIGQRIITASAQELEAICRTAHMLFWRICLGVAALQLALATMLFFISGQSEAAMMLAVLSLVYLVMPPGLVPVFLVMRSGKLGTTARISATQSMLDHILTMVLVLAWPGSWAIILPKLLTAPVWTMLARKAHRWEYDGTIAPAPVREFSAYAAGILGSEILGAVRLQGDKILIAALLGNSALGLYYFAFNAGLGITQTLTGAFNTVLLPHLCLAKAGTERTRRLGIALIISLCALVPLVAIQVFLAPWYVPILFGAHWQNAARPLAMLAMAGIPLLCASALGAHFRANSKPVNEAWLNSAATLAALALLALGSLTSITLACAGYTLGLALVFIPAAFLILRPHTIFLSDKGVLA